MTGGAQVDHLGAPGMPCPDCGQRLVVDTAQLLSMQPLRCPRCGLELRVNAAESAGALDALRSYLGDVGAAADGVADSLGGDGSTRVGRGRPPRRRSTSRSRRTRGGT